MVKRTYDTPPGPASSRDVSPRLQEISLVHEDLILKFKETRDPQVFERLVEFYQPQLEAYAHRSICSRLRNDRLNMAEDFANEAFRRLFKNIDNYDGDKADRPSAYLLRIVSNLVTDFARKESKVQFISLESSGRRNSVEDSMRLNPGKLTSREPDPHEEAARNEEAVMLRRQVGSLSPKLRDTIELTGLQDLKNCEAAEILGINLNTVKSRIHKAVRLLRSALEHRLVGSG